jgi:type II secretory pathway predicted ATPase ExeA
MKLEEHFALSGPPFPRAATPASLLRTSAMEHAIERLRFALERDTIALLVAESGCGKSTVLFELAKTLDCARYNVLSISLTTVRPFGLLSQFLGALGAPAKRGGHKGEIATTLLRHLRALAKQSVLMIDEAHLLPDESLEDLRLLGADNLDRHSPFSVILVGQPILRDRLAEPQHYALWQRIGVRLKLRPLNQQELASFLDRHLEAAGASARLFEPLAVNEIFQHSRGVPRLVQNLALDSMLAAMTAGKKTVDQESVQQALLDMDAL